MYEELRRAALAALAISTHCCEAQTTASATTTAATSSRIACPTVLAPTYSAPVVAAGYTAQLIATGLSAPRGILFDQAGALLVVQQGVGIQHLVLDDYGGTCLTVNKSTALVTNSNLTHGIELSGDGKTLYASTSEEVFSWAYDQGAVAVSNQQTIIRNMSNGDHTTRTLLLSRKQPDLMLVARGSGENIDPVAADITSGRSQIRIFNLTNMTAGQVYDQPSEGAVLGWGLRNSVGVAEEPTTGNIYSVENSADDVERDGTDIHEDDPGEEMNSHGPLNATLPTVPGPNHGYPDCYALWAANIPDPGTLTVGNQFTLDPTAMLNDSSCQMEFVPPRLTFQAHMAPLDIKFTADGSLAYVSFHGSWDRQPPVGYKVSTIAFAQGQPVAPANSTTALFDVLSSPNATACPGACVRPVGLVLDAQGRVFVSSDSTGEIYVLMQNSNAPGTGPTSSGTVSASGTLITSTSTGSATPGAVPDGEWLLALTVALLAVGGTFFLIG